MKFFTDYISNIFLVILAVGTGLALLIPILQRRGAKVSLLQAMQRLNQAKSSVIDVRLATEFEVGHIKGAKNIPLVDLSKRISELGKQKNNPILVVCENGTRSSKAVAMLVKAGFANAASLDGGLAVWREQGLPIVK